MAGIYYILSVYSPLVKQEKEVNSGPCIQVVVTYLCTLVIID